MGGTIFTPEKLLERPEPRTKSDIRGSPLESTLGKIRLGYSGRTAPDECLLLRLGLLFFELECDNVDGGIIGAT